CCLKSLRVVRLAASERSLLDSPEHLVERDDQGPQASSSKVLTPKSPRRTRSVTTECCLKSLRVVRPAAPERSPLDSPEHLVERDDQGPQASSSKALPPKSLRRPRSVTTECCLKSLRVVRLAAPRRSLLDSPEHLVERDDQGPQASSSKVLPPKAPRRPRSVTTECCLKSLRVVRLAAPERSLLDSPEHLVERDDQGPQASNSRSEEHNALRRHR